MKVGALADGYGMKEENIVNNIEPVKSSTLREEQRFVVSGRIKAMALLSTMYSLCIRNMANEKKLGFGKEMRWNMDFAPADPP